MNFSPLNINHNSLFIIIAWLLKASDMIIRSIIKQMEKSKYQEGITLKLRLLMTTFWKNICNYSKDLHSLKILFLTIFV